MQLARRIRAMTFVRVERNHGQLPITFSHCRNRNVCVGDGAAWAVGRAVVDADGTKPEAVRAFSFFVESADRKRDGSKGGQH